MVWFRLVSVIYRVELGVAIGILSYEFGDSRVAMVSPVGVRFQIIDYGSGFGLPYGLTGSCHRKSQLATVAS